MSKWEEDITTKIETDAIVSICEDKVTEKDPFQRKVEVSDLETTVSSDVSQSNNKDVLSC